MLIYNADDAVVVLCASLPILQKEKAMHHSNKKSHPFLSLPCMFSWSD